MNSHHISPARMRLSIAMCTYNATKFVEEQLSSFVAQTRRPDELVICDDRSDDQTVAVVKRFAAVAPFEVRIYENPVNLGATKNFEKAFQLSTGDVIAPSSWDDVWMPDKLEKLEGALLRSPEVGLVMSDAELVDKSLTSMGRTLWQVRRFHRIDRFFIQRGQTERLLRKNLGATYGGTMAFRAIFKPFVLPIPETWLEDAWLATVISSMAKVALIDEPLMKYRHHGTNPSGAGTTAIRTRIGAAQRNTNSTFVERAQRLELAQERLRTMRAGRDDFLYRLGEAERHMIRRGQLAGRRLHRLLPVITELAKGQYRRYSDGWRSAAADLLLR